MMRIKYLILFVTSVCNSRCVMCFNSTLDAPGQNELTLGEYEKIAKKLSSPLESLMISGGEPSLRRDLPQICQFFYNLCKVRKIYLPLNGQDTEKCIDSIINILGLCSDVHLYAGLSVDGVGKIHDMQRGVGGSFDRVMYTHQQLYELSKRYANLHRGVITTLTKINIKNIAELFGYIYNLSSQPDYHDIMPCRIQYGNKTKEGLLITPEEYRNALDIADKYAAHYCKKKYGGLILSKIAYLRHKVLNVIYKNAYVGKKIIECKAPSSIRVIESDGEVRICELMQSMGNIRNYDYSLHKIDKLLKLSSKKVDCVCTHPCFVTPSLKYPSNIFACLRYGFSNYRFW